MHLNSWHVKGRRAAGFQKLMGIALIIRRMTFSKKGPGWKLNLHKGSFTGVIYSLVPRSDIRSHTLSMTASFGLFVTPSPL